MSHLAPYTPGGLAAYDGIAAAQRTDAHDISRLWSALRRRWRLFAAIAGGFVALVTLVTLIVPKSYTTTVRLMAGRAGSSLNATERDTAFPILNALVLQSGEQSAETFAQLAQQRDLSARVVDKMGLAISPSSLLRRLTVKPIVNTSLLNLSVSWRTPEGSAKIANAFADSFVDQERDFVRSEATAAIGYLSQELPYARDRMTQTAGRLADFQAKNGFTDATAHSQDIVGRIGGIEQRIDQLTVDASEARALLQNVNGQLSSLPLTIDSAKQVAANPVLADLRTKLAAVDTQLATAQKEYTPVHPAVLALREQHQALLAQIAAQPADVNGGVTLSPNPLRESLLQQSAAYRARVDGDEAQLRQLQAQRSAYRPALSSLPRQAMQFESISQDAKRASSVYTALVQKYNEAIIARTTAISDISVVQRANPNAASVSPILAINIAVAIVLGIMIGLAVIYALEMMENRVQGDADLPKMLGLPVIARIPSLQPANQRMLPWVQSMTVEAFLHLCVTLRLKSKRQLRSLSIVSPSRGDGKSTIAFNLAQAMSNLQPRILLVDADLRRPTLHEKAHCRNEIGLSDVLAGTASLENAAQRVSPSLDILTSGPAVENPVALLGMNLEAVIREAERQYEMVIIDAPALRAVSDGFLISTQVDGTLLVIAANSTDEREARNTVVHLSVLGIDNVLGIVLNKDTARMEDYSDYFAHGFSQALAGGRA